MKHNSRGPASLILFATLTATAGTGISIIAFPWLALQHHDSAKDASIVAAAMAIPLVLCTLVAGTAVDFFGRRPVSLVADSLSGASVAAVPLIGLLCGVDAINVAILAVLAFFAAGFDPAGSPTGTSRCSWGGL
jgi:MFS family permease